MLTLELRDILVVISVFIVTITLLILFNIIVDNFSSGNSDFKYFLTGSYLIFYIAFVFPFMYFNVFIGIILFWVLILIINVYFIFKKIKIFNTIKNIKFNFTQKMLILLLSVTQLLVLYGDALYHISHTWVDTSSNLSWINSNITEIGKVAYFPGLSIVSILSVKLIDPLYSLNFFAASLGLTFTICINLIVKSILSFKGLVVFNLVLLTPFYYALTYTRAGLNNSQLFPIIFLGIIVFINIKWQDSSYSKYIYGLALSVAALVTAPHILFLTIPGIFVALVLTYKPSKTLTKIWLILLAISAIIFSRLLSSPDIIFEEKGIDQDSLNLFDTFYVIMIDWIRIKHPIRPPLESIESLGAYLIITLAIWALIVSRKRNIKPIMFISILTIVFGITLQTGIGEIAFMKGRIGWYFMWTSALLISLVFDQFKLQLPKMIKSDIGIGLLLIVNFLFVIFNLPDAYRMNNENILIEMRKLAAEDTRGSLIIYSDLPYMRFVSEKITVTQEFPSHNIDYFVLNNGTQLPDFYLANIRAYEDRNIENFENQQTIEINKRLEKNLIIFDYATQRGFNVIVEDSEYVILKN